MKLILSEQSILDRNQQTFTCFEVKKRKSISEPFQITQTEILKQSAEGEVFHNFYRVSCRWEVGEEISWN